MMTRERNHWPCVLTLQNPKFTLESYNIWSVLSLRKWPVWSWKKKRRLLPNAWLLHISPLSPTANSDLQYQNVHKIWYIALCTVGVMVHWTVHCWCYGALNCALLVLWYIALCTVGVMVHWTVHCWCYVVLNCALLVLWYIELCTVGVML